MAEQRLTFAAPGQIDLQARRMAASVRALDGYDLFAIETGIVKQLVDAALHLTAEVDRLLVLHDQDRTRPFTKGTRRKLEDASRLVLDLRAQLKRSG